MTARPAPSSLPDRVRRRWLSGLMSLGLALSAALAAAPAGATTHFRIDSVASCQQFLTAMGANLGTAAPGRCDAMSEGSEIHLPAGASLTVARGWRLSIRSVVFFNEGRITNFGTFSAIYDVVNNVGDARFVNHGKVVVQTGSAFNLSDDALFVNKRGARVDANVFWDGATAVNRGTIRTPRLVVADWYDAVLENRGRILITCGGSASGPVTGRQPVLLPCHPCSKHPVPTPTS